MANKDDLIEDVRLIAIGELRQLVPFSDAHLWRLEKAGKFPKRIKLSNHRVAWSFREIRLWIEDKKGKRT